MYVNPVGFSIINPGLYDANKVPLGFLWHFLRVNCVNFVEMLCSKVLATFADHHMHGLLRFLTSSQSMKGTAMASFQVQ